ncbi:MAG: tRNA (5-methylaminomethyl-2-thiouridine)(34)-methyltransferase MnmD [Balneolaceae bacterium]
MSDKPIIQPTRDGSSTLYSPKFEQPYHSRGGAVAESRVVYFESTGLIEKLQNGEPLSILEIGFGSGLNLVLLLDYIAKTNSDSKISFAAVDAYPIEPDTAKNLNFGEELQYIDYRTILSNIFSNLQPGWNFMKVHDQVEIHLFYGLFDEMHFPPKPDSSNPFDVVLHDPFSPESNPAGWTSDLFKKIAAHSSKTAILSTYSAASSGRAAMAVAGWFVARSPGALGKREMTVASLSESPLCHLKRVNEQRLIERWEARDFG